MIDLDKCPNCGGPADNGHSRSLPPSPYWCSQCDPDVCQNFEGDCRTAQPRLNSYTAPDKPSRLLCDACYVKVVDPKWLMARLRELEEGLWLDLEGLRLDLENYD